MNLLEAVWSGGVLIYPADTVWGLGGDARNEALIHKVLKIKKRPPEKGFIVLVPDWESLQNIVGPVPASAREILEKSLRPTTLIYPRFQGLPALAGAPDGSLAVRLVKRGFVHNLMKVTGVPLLSTSANLSGHPVPRSLDEMDPFLLRQADYVVNLHRSNRNIRPSRILKLLPDGNIRVIRD